MSQSTRTFLAVVYGVLWAVSFASSQEDGPMANSAENVINELYESSLEREVIRKDVIKPWELDNEATISVKTAKFSKEPLPSDCADLFNEGNTKSGVYTIYVGGKQRSLQVYCDMTTSGGGWTVLQRRFDGKASFYHGWTFYVNGFGSVSEEYWIGNQNMHALTLDKKHVLRIDMADFDGNSRYAEYTDFKVGAACEKYKLLSVGTYCGNAGDSLSYHVGSKFSTFDQDNDSQVSNCAAVYKGAWWYHSCHVSNLNGLYLRGPHNSYADGVNWQNWRGYHYSLQRVEMKIRPANFNA